MLTRTYKFFYTVLVDGVEEDRVFRIVERNLGRCLTALRKHETDPIVRINDYKIIR